MRLMIAMLVVGAVIIVAGFTFILIELGRRAAEAPPAVAPEAPRLPEGAVVEEMAATSDRVVLRVRLADGSQQLFLLDPRTGRLREGP